MGVVTTRHDEAATVQVVTHGTPQFYQIAVTVIGVPGYWMASARASEVPVAEAGTAVPLKSMASVPVMLAKAVTSVDLSVDAELA